MVLFGAEVAATSAPDKTMTLIPELIVCQNNANQTHF